MQNFDAKMDHVDMRINSLNENIKFVVQYVQQRMQHDQAESQKFASGLDTPIHDTSSYSHNNNNKESHNYKKSINLELPKILIINPRRWVLKASQFFGFHHGPQCERLQLASFTMDGDALEWF